MQIDQGNDTLDPTSTTASSVNPTFKISSIVTSVHVQSGDIIVLGGLSQDGLGTDKEGIPILGNIPGVGRLFQRNTRSRNKRVLMVFIKPIILRNERENLQVTGEKYNETRQYQMDWLRSEEAFVQSDIETVLPPLTQARLPRPFTDPPPAVLKTPPAVLKTKEIWK
jgi:general secretion pathway protein D